MVALDHSLEKLLSIPPQKNSTFLLSLSSQLPVFLGGHPNYVGSMFSGLLSMKRLDNYNQKGTSLYSTYPDEGIQKIELKDCSDIANISPVNLHNLRELLDARKNEGDLRGFAII